jgi:hypothetical protein
MPEKKQDETSKFFCGKISRFFSLCCRIDQRRRAGRVSFTAARKHIPRLERVLLKLCSSELDDADAENLRKRITDPARDSERLFTFLNVNGMPPTNNHAEQSLRLPVIFRKITFGSQSQNGADALARNLSLLTTAKRQKKDPLTLFQALLLHGGKAPLSLLYNFKSYPQVYG